MIVQMKVPVVGESIQEVEIAQWLKQEGQWVEQDEDVVEVDSEKASLPIPAPTSGRIVKILKRGGDTAEVGEVIAEIDDAAKPAQSEVGVKQAVVQQELPDQQQDLAAKGQPRMATSLAATAAKTKVPVARDTSRPNRIVTRSVSEDADEDASRADALSYEAPRATEPRQQRVEQPEQATATTVTAREEEIVPMSMIRRRIAARLVEAQQNSALLTTFNEIDMSAVIELRSELRQPFQEQHGIKLGFMSFFVKSAVEALKQFPEVNAEVRGNDVVFRNYYDIGVAIGGGKGLVVPVLRSADQLSFAEVEWAIDDFANRAVSNKLRPEELAGGTFTISNGGIYGSLLSTPIVNPPQSGVLGMHAIQDRPVARKGQVVIRPMMYVALTYDHRIVDGREAVGFLHRIKDLIEQPSRILLEV
jgi:2-oxoglutarate dehydrogenase E2 component (dihydrolipoamide succinyltransferase)